MEKYFGNAYRGDPGVPHAGPERFMNIWIGSAAFSGITFINPYMWQLSNQFNTFGFGGVGMTKQCYLSSITGRKHWRRSSRINSSGTSTWTRTCVTRTTITGPSISLRRLLLESQALMFCYHSWYQWNLFSLNEPCPVSVSVVVMHLPCNLHDIEIPFIDV